MILAAIVVCSDGSTLAYSSGGLVGDGNCGSTGSIIATIIGNGEGDGHVL